MSSLFKRIAATRRHGRLPHLLLIVGILVLGGCSGLKSVTSKPSSTPRAYVSNNGDNSVSVLDLDAGKEVASIKIPRVGARYAFPAFIVASNDGAKVYVANLNQMTISVIDTGSNTVSKRIDLDRTPRDMAFTPDGRKLYVGGDGKVAYVIDPSTDAIVAKVPLGEASIDVAVAPDGRFAYITTASGAISVVDVATDTVVRSIVDLRGASGIAVDSVGRTAYVLRNDHLGRVYVVDLESGKVTADVRVEDSPITAALSPDGGALYVVNRGSDTVSVVDTQPPKLRGNIAAGTVPSSIALSRDGKRLYVTASASNAVYVLSPETREVITKIPILNSATPRPLGIALIEP